MVVVSFTWNVNVAEGSARYGSTVPLDKAIVGLEPPLGKLWRGIAWFSETSICVPMAVATRMAMRKTGGAVTVRRRTLRAQNENGQRNTMSGIRMATKQ